MKIAIYYNLNFGGAKRVVMNHARGLRDRGHTVDLYTINHEKDVFDPSPFCENTYNYNFTLDTSIPFFKRFIYDYKNFFVFKDLHKKIATKMDSRRYDMVLVHPDKLTQAPYILQFLKTPSVYYCQEPLRIVYEYSYRLKEKVDFLRRIYEELTRLYRKQIDRQNVRAASFAVASCNYVRERMIESYEVYPKVVYCAVDQNVFRETGIKKRNQVFYVGSSNVWEDGYDLAFNAMKLISKEIRPTLRKVSWKKDNGERLTDEELVMIYNESIATLCTSRLETFGLTPLESMACGTPVIATEVSGHRETILDGKTGFLVDFDPKEIAEKLTFIINNPKLAAEIGENSKRWVKKQWTWDVQVINLEKLLYSFIINK
ncbi:MAG: glycosyltransferase family 4 protein [bacterium]|nr:glycosyltransferase family 4 protein [bacterium]